MASTILVIKKVNDNVVSTYMSKKQFDKWEDATYMQHVSEEEIDGMVLSDYLHNDSFVAIEIHPSYELV